MVRNLKEITDTNLDFFLIVIDVVIFKVQTSVPNLTHQMGFIAF